MLFADLKITSNLVHKEYRKNPLCWYKINKYIKKALYIYLYMCIYVYVGGIAAPTDFCAATNWQVSSTDQPHYAV